MADPVHLLSAFSKHAEKPFAPRNPVPAPSPKNTAAAGPSQPGPSKTDQHPVQQPPTRVDPSKLAAALQSGRQMSSVSLNLMSSLPSSLFGVGGMLPASDLNAEATSGAMEGPSPPNLTPATSLLIPDIAEPAQGVLKDVRQNSRQSSVGGAGGGVAINVPMHIGALQAMLQQQAALASLGGLHGLYPVGAATEGAAQPNGMEAAAVLQAAGMLNGIAPNVAASTFTSLPLALHPTHLATLSAAAQAMLPPNIAAPSPSSTTPTAGGAPARGGSLAGGGSPPMHARTPPLQNSGNAGGTMLPISPSNTTPDNTATDGGGAGGGQPHSNPPPTPATPHPTLDTMVAMLSTTPSLKQDLKSFLNIAAMAIVKAEGNTVPEHVAACGGASPSEVQRVFQAVLPLLPPHLRELGSQRAYEVYLQCMATGVGGSGAGGEGEAGARGGGEHGGQVDDLNDVAQTLLQLDRQAPPKAPPSRPIPRGRGAGRGVGVGGVGGSGNTSGRAIKYNEADEGDPNDGGALGAGGAGTRGVYNPSPGLTWYSNAHQRSSVRGGPPHDGGGGGHHGKARGGAHAHGGVHAHGDAFGGRHAAYKRHRDDDDDEEEGGQSMYKRARNDTRDGVGRLHKSRRKQTRRTDVRSDVRGDIHYHQQHHESQYEGVYVCNEGVYGSSDEDAGHRTHHYNDGDDDGGDDGGDRDMAQQSGASTSSGDTMGVGMTESTFRMRSFKGGVPGKRRVKPNSKFADTVELTDDDEDSHDTSPPTHIPHKHLARQRPPPGPPPDNQLYTTLRMRNSHTTDGLPIPYVLNDKGNPQNIIWYSWLMEHGFFSLTMEGAAARLQVGNTTLKKACRRLNITRWPYRKATAADDTKRKEVFQVPAAETQAFQQHQLQQPQLQQQQQLQQPQVQQQQQLQQPQVQQQQQLQQHVLSNTHQLKAAAGHAVRGGTRVPGSMGPTPGVEGKGKGVVKGGVVYADARQQARAGHGVGAGSHGHGVGMAHKALGNVVVRGPAAPPVGTWVVAGAPRGGSAGQPRNVHSWMSNGVLRQKQHAKAGAGGGHGSSGHGPSVAPVKEEQR